MVDQLERAARAAPVPTSETPAGARRPGPAAWVAFLVPACLLLWSLYAVWRTYSPTPYVDQWADFYWWRQAPRTGWLHYLFSQCNEHRILFPRLVFMADWAWFQSNDILNLVAVGLTQLIGAGLFVRTAQPRRAGAIGLLGLATALALLFSLTQWETFFWGFCLQNAGVYAAAAWAIYAFCIAIEDPQAPRWGWMAGAMALLTVATFNMANGVLAGAAMLLIAVVTRRGIVVAAAAGLATAALLALYLHGYQATAPHPSPVVMLQRPGPFIAYAASFLGNIWSPGRIPPAVFAGLAGAAATAAMVWVVARDRGRDPARAALAGVALFVGLSAAMTSFGRQQMGVELSHSSRYMTATAYFWAAQAVFWTLTAERCFGRRARLALGAALILALLRLLAVQPIGEKQLLVAHKQVQLGTSAILGGVDDGVAITGVRLFVDPAIFRDDVAYLRSQRISLFADPPPATVGGKFTPRLAPPGACKGAFGLLYPAPVFGVAPPPAAATILRAEGWGWDAQARQSFTRVVLVDGSGTVVGIGLFGVKSGDAKRAVPQSRGVDAGWIASINRGAGGGVIAYGVTAAGPVCELGRKPWPR